MGRVWRFLELCNNHDEENRKENRIRESTRGGGEQTENTGEENGFYSGSQWDTEPCLYTITQTKTQSCTKHTNDHAIIMKFH